MRAPRQRVGKLALCDIEAGEYLRLLGMHGRSGSVDGRIKSQYEERLLAGDGSVGAFALEACGEVVGGLSWGEILLPCGRGISGRLDTVFSSSRLRGNGIGAILVSEFVRLMQERNGERLSHLSTIAVHPGVAHMVEDLGFERAGAADLPLWQADLREAGGKDVLRGADRTRQRRLSTLRQGCIDCQQKSWTTPWCSKEGAR